MILCDGCRLDVKPGEVHAVMADGHEGRYCAACHEMYESFTNACQAEENRLNALLTVFIAETRDKVPLHFVPQDLPPIKRACEHSMPIVLR